LNFSTSIIQPVAKDYEETIKKRRKKERRKDQWQIEGGREACNNTGPLK
jgi:hypothetical protein